MRRRIIVVRIIRVAFLVVFARVGAAGAFLRARASYGAEIMPGAALAGAAALVLAAAVVFLEMCFSRRFAAHLSSVIYGAVVGWVVGSGLLWAAKGLSCTRMWLEPDVGAALTLGLMYLGAIVAIRSKASGHLAVRISLKDASDPSSDRAVWWLRVVFALFVIACVAIFWLGPRAQERPAAAQWASLILVLLLPASWVVELISGKRLLGILLIVLPAVFFAAATAGQTFILLSAAPVLNYYVLLEFQQIALFVLWLYVGMALMLQQRA